MTAHRRINHSELQLDISEVIIITQKPFRALSRVKETNCAYWLRLDFAAAPQISPKL